MEHRQMLWAAKRWIKANEVPVPLIWQERIAECCAEFAEFMFGQLNEQNTYLAQQLKDAIDIKPTPPIVIHKEGE